MQIFASGKWRFHCFKEFYVIHSRNQGVKIWLWYHFKQSNFIHLLKWSLQQHDTTSSIDERCKQESTKNSNNFLNLKLSFPPRKFNVVTKFTPVFTTIRWPVISIRRPKAKRRNHLSVWQPRSSATLCFVQHICRHSNLFFANCQSVHFWWKNSFAFRPKDCTLLRVDFLSRNNRV